MEYFERMRDIRDDADETQQNIADYLKITRQQYQLYESGKRIIPLDLLQVFCAHYKVSSDYILGLPKGLKWPNETGR